MLIKINFDPSSQEGAFIFETDFQKTTLAFESDSEEISKIMTSFIDAANAQQKAYEEAIAAGLSHWLNIATIRFGHRIDGWITHIRLGRYLKYLSEKQDENSQ
jgi:hypothetical protein